MFKKASYFIMLFAALIFSFPIAHADVNRWDLGNTYEISVPELTVYKEPHLDSEELFTIYHGMEVHPSESVVVDGFKWFRIEDRDYWIPAIEPGGIVNVTIQSADEEVIKDYYGVLDMPHRYAVKMVKEPDAHGWIETYEKVGDEYVLRETYPVTYRKDGPKSRFGDLRTAGGTGIRYLFRTTRSSMNGWNSEGERFGVYKVSYPMPHDAYPQLLSGRLNLYQYNHIPVVNRTESGRLLPQPGSALGADIVLHTARKGSRGCINIENERMSHFYSEDIVTENDQEIIPFVIYDEDVVAPPVGQLL